MVDKSDESREERTQFFESKMANMDAVQEVFQPVTVLREEWEGQHSKSRDPVEDLAAKKRADNQQARASHQIENVPGTPRSLMQGDAESAHPSQHAEAESREDEVRASSQHAEAESREDEVRAQKKQRVTEEVRNKLLESDKMMLEKVTDKINTMVSTLMKGFDFASMKLDYATSVLAPYDETHLQLLVDATDNRLQNLYAVRHCLVGMFEWVDEPMQHAVTKYCERYESFLEHRLRLLKTCFVGMGPWPIESKSGMHAEKVPSSYKFAEKWTILTRDVIQCVEKVDFLQWLYDGVQYNILLAPPAGAHIHCEWEYDAQWHEKKGKHYDRNKRDHHLRGGERFVFHAIVFGEYVKHRCSTKVQGIQDYLKDAVKKGKDTHGVEFLKEVKHWMSEACLQEIHLSESEGRHPGDFRPKGRLPHEAHGEEAEETRLTDTQAPREKETVEGSCINILIAKRAVFCPQPLQHSFLFFFNLLLGSLWQSRRSSSCCLIVTGSWPWTRCLQKRGRGLTKSMLEQASR